MSILLKLPPELEALQPQKPTLRVKCCGTFVTGQEDLITGLPGLMACCSANKHSGSEAV